MQEQEIEMQVCDIELQVGDTLQIDDYLVTVVDIDGDEVSVRIDPVDEFAEVNVEDGIVTMDR